MMHTLAMMLSFLLSGVIDARPQENGQALLQINLAKDRTGVFDSDVDRSRPAVQFPRSEHATELSNAIPVLGPMMLVHRFVRVGGGVSILLIP